MSEVRTPEQRVAELGLKLPAPPSAVAAYQPYVLAGTTVHVSGQIAMRNGELVARGRLGADLDLSTGQECARACALNLLAQLRAAAGGSLNTVRRMVKVNVYVASEAEFVDQPQVANGASQLLLDVLGSAGAHARSAIGVAALPLGTPVEIDAVTEIDLTDGTEHS
jgi:enamine deaminase RidA (YjgF/YER057c/UK114 family)